MRSLRSSLRISSVDKPELPVAYLRRTSSNSLSHAAVSTGVLFPLTAAPSARVSRALGLPSTVMTTSSPWLAISTSLGNSAWLLDNVVVTAGLYFFFAQGASKLSRRTNHVLNQFKRRFNLSLFQSHARYLNIN